MKSKTSIAALVVCTTFQFETALADVHAQATMLGKEGAVTIWTQADRARAELDGSDQYDIFDFEKNAVYAVSPKDKHVIMGTGKTAIGAAPADGGTGRLELVKLDSDLEVAGFKTEQYRVSIDGNVCLDAWIAKDLDVTPELERLALLTSVPSPLHYKEMFSKACVAERFDNVFSDVGLPLLIKSKDGGLILEVRRLEIQASPPAGTYEWPASYEVKSLLNLWGIE